MKNKTIFPDFIKVDGLSKSSGGLTKREYFAGLAMQGMIARESGLKGAPVATTAVKYADDLIKELEETNENENNSSDS